MDNKTPPQSPQAPAEEKETASCPLCGDEFPDRWVKVLVQCTKPRTPQDMDGTLTLIFAKLKTTWDITTKISVFLSADSCKLRASCRDLFSLSLSLSLRSLFSFSDVSWFSNVSKLSKQSKISRNSKIFTKFLYFPKFLKFPKISKIFQKF